MDGLLQRSLTQYRLARPISTSAQPKTFAFESWTASSFVPGRVPTAGRFNDRIITSRVFHADLEQRVTEKPGTIERRPNRWTKADQVTWDGTKLDEVEGLNETLFSHIRPLLDRFKQVWRPLPKDLQHQLIHGDLTATSYSRMTRGFHPL